MRIAFAGQVANALYYLGRTTRVAGCPGDGSAGFLEIGNRSVKPALGRFGTGGDGCQGLIHFVGDGRRQFAHRGIAADVGEFDLRAMQLRFHIMGMGQQAELLLQFIAGAPIFQSQPGGNANGRQADEAARQCGTERMLVMGNKEPGSRQHRAGQCHPAQPANRAGVHGHHDDQDVQHRHCDVEFREGIDEKNRGCGCPKRQALCRGARGAGHDIQHDPALAMLPPPKGIKP
ncbi:hypothetical protein D3C87_1162530 [compost metagenome]